MDDLKALGDAVDAALGEMSDATTAIREAGDDADFDKLDRAFKRAERTHQTAVAEYRRADQKAALAEAKRSLPVSPHQEGAPEGSGGSSGPGEPRKRGAKHIRVSREPLTYEMYDSEGKISERSFFRDLRNAGKGDIGAMERLAAHNREMVIEKRALSDTAAEGGSFVAPIYAMDLWVKLARAGRVTADACTPMELPPNTNSINFPKLKTGTLEAPQADLGTVTSGTPETETISVPVVTIAGNQDLSRQLFDRMLPGYDQVLFGDLAAVYATKLNVNVLSGNGSSPNSRGILETAGIEKVTFTSASPTVAELYGYLADALQRINSKRYMPATAFIMHPRRWGWLLAQVDTTGRPLVVPHALGQFNPVGNLENVAAQGIVGSLLGVPVLLDPSIPTNKGAGTNQDQIIAARLEDLYLWEDQSNPVVFKVFEEVLSSELAIRLQAFGYSAFTGARYPQSVAVVEGTGLVTPTFT